MAWEADLARIFKALAHPNRVKLFLEIARGEASIEEMPAEGGCMLHGIIERLGVGAPTCSHHLKELVQAGLVHTERRGKFLSCRVDRGAMERLATFFSYDAASASPEAAPLTEDLA